MLSKVEEKPGEHLLVLGLLAPAKQHRWKSIPLSGLGGRGPLIWGKTPPLRHCLISLVEPAVLLFTWLCLRTLHLVLRLLKRQDMTGSLEWCLNQLFFTRRCRRAPQAQVRGGQAVLPVSETWGFFVAVNSSTCTHHWMALLGNASGPARKWLLLVLWSGTNTPRSQPQHATCNTSQCAFLREVPHQPRVRAFDKWEEEEDTVTAWCTADPFQVTWGVLGSSQRNHTRGPVLLCWHSWSQRRGWLSSWGKEETVNLGGRRVVGWERMHEASGLQARLISKAARVGKSKKGQKEKGFTQVISRLFPRQ